MSSAVEVNEQDKRFLVFLVVSSRLALKVTYFLCDVLRETLCSLWFMLLTLTTERAEFHRGTPQRDLTAPQTPSRSSYDLDVEKRRATE
jgi:hypothetical protein